MCLLMIVKLGLNILATRYTLLCDSSFEHGVFFSNNSESNASELLENLT